MKYLNIEVDTLRKPEYLGSDPVDRATWLNLMAWSASQENGGVIKSCEDWPDRKWQQLCGITWAEVHRTCELFTFDKAGNLHVLFYPADKEKEVKNNRRNGKKGGRPRKSKTPEEPTEKPSGFKSLNPKGTERQEIAETEGKGREEERKEKEGESLLREAPPVDDLEEIFPTSAAREVDRVVKNLNDVKASFKAAPHLSQLEITAISQNLRLLSSIEDEQWTSLKDFIESGEGAKSAWLFSSRQRLLENIAEALQKSAEWHQRKTASLPANGGRGPGRVVSFKKSK